MLITDPYTLMVNADGLPIFPPGNTPGTTLEAILRRGRAHCRFPRPMLAAG